MRDVHVTLRRLSLRYADGTVMHTALSGEVAALDELRLVVTAGGAVAALGAARVNIAYLTGLDPDALVRSCRELAASLDWSTPLAALDAASDADLPAPVRMLFEMAAVDARARAAGLALSRYLGGPEAPSVTTNQSLFRASDDAVIARAGRYAARGFRDLKLRVGFAGLADDLTLLRRLRALDAGLLLSLDANGAWREADAHARLQALAPFGLRYVEQPVAEWDAASRVAATSPVPVMLDESLSDLAAVRRLAQTRIAPLAHVKLAKLGGIDRLMEAGALLRGAGIGVMVGQMNEGSVSTLAAAHAAVALAAPLCELYGADGLLADPAGLLRYADGALHLPPGPGLGLLRHDGDGTLIWET